MNPLPNRRRFLLRTGTVATGLLLLANRRLAVAAAANDRLRVAAVGAAGQGRSNIDSVAGLGHDFVALCDVDHAHAADTFKKFPQARVYRDYRRMLDEMGGQVDAVIVSTPDHTHAVAAAAAMRAGKPVYCEKPLTRTVHEARVLREVARTTGVVTQMGNQGSASGNLRRAVELVWGGVLGEVREAHVWFDGGNGPLERPVETPAVPATLDWDGWLGPAPHRPYHPAYLPAKWRSWRAFGSGTLGDMGCHTANLMFRALRLNELWEPGTAADAANRRLKVRSWPSEVNVEGYPTASRTEIQVPPRGSLPAVKLTLYAKEKPSPEVMLGWPMAGWGDLLVGSRGSIYSECPWNTNYVLLPEARFSEFKGGPPPSLPRTDSHHREWVDACRGRGQTFSPFAMGGPLTELLQLVNLAGLVDGAFEYDPVAGRIVDHPRANDLLHREYRPGWTL